MVEFAADRPQACFDVAEAFSVGQLCEGHCQELVPTREALVLVIARIATHAFLELITGKVTDDLRENRVAEIHLSLSAIAVNASPAPFSGGKEFKSKNLKNRLSCRT